MDDKPTQATETIIDQFGGIRPMAAKLDIPVKAVQGWSKGGIIPQARHPDILAAAARDNIALDASVLAATDPGAMGRGDARIADAEPIISAPIARRRRSPAAGLALGLSLLTLTAVAAAGFAAWQLYLQPLAARVAALEATPAPDAAVKDLRGRVDALEARIAQASAVAAALQASAAAAQGNPAAAALPAQPNSAESDRLSALEKQIADIKAGSAEVAQLARKLSDLQVAAGGRELLTQSILDIQSSTAATQGEVERFSKELGALTTRVDKDEAALAQRRQQSMRAEAAMLAVGELGAALRTNAPYAKDIAAVRALAAGDPEMSAVLDQIQPYADDGVRSKDDLRADFGHLAPNVVRSAVVRDGSEWWRQALYHIESVISVRRVGQEVQGGAADAMVARAEEKLEEDDLKGAIAALQPLTGLSAEVAQPWLHDAQERVAVDSAEAELTRLSIGRVAGGNAAPGQAQPQPQTQPEPQSQPQPQAQPEPQPQAQPRAAQ